MNWGKAIALGYTSFAAFMIFMAVKSVGQQIDLVTPDYYGEEIKVNNFNEKLKNTEISIQKLQFSANQNTIILDFSEWDEAKKIFGEVKVFCPSDAKLDRAYAFVLTDNPVFIIKTDQFAARFYKIQVDWNVDGKEFFEEFTYLKK